MKDNGGNFRNAFLRSLPCEFIGVFFFLSMEYSLGHQTSDFLVHLAKKVHIAVSHWVDAFVFN